MLEDQRYHEWAWKSSEGINENSTKLGNVGRRGYIACANRKKKEATWFSLQYILQLIKQVNRWNWVSAAY